MRRAGWRCEWPGHTTAADVLHMAHIIPKGMGGTHGERAKYINSLENTAALCPTHHTLLDSSSYEIRVLWASYLGRGELNAD